MARKTLIVCDRCQKEITPGRVTTISFNNWQHDLCKSCADATELFLCGKPSPQP